ncbi:MAG: ABC1 kinase family protein [Acidobacteriota bacterium]
MSISLRPEHLKRYRDLAWLLIKYGRSDLISQAGLDKIITDSDRPQEVIDPKVEELPRDLEMLGPTYVKLGQFLSTRSDMLPPQYMDALERLQDQAQQFPYEVVEQIITSELGIRMSRAFAFFDKEPMAAASLAQVHRAVLHTGRLVAVKVQRPGIRDQIIKDLDAFEDVAEFLDKHSQLARRFMLQATLGEFRRALLRELDFRQEAQNLSIMRNNLRQYEMIVIPAPVEEYTSSSILTMDFINGEKITQITPRRRLEIDSKRLADDLFRAYMQQILLDGFYHADPHPGNVLLTEDGKIGLVDLGMVARVSEGLQNSLLRLLMAVSEGKSEDAVHYALEIGEKTEAFDDQDFANRIQELVTRYQRVTIKEIEVGRVVLEVFKIAADNGIHFPSELAMLGKSLLNLDNIGRTLDPAFDPNAAIRRYSNRLLAQKLRQGVSRAGVFEMLMESREFIQLLPRRVNKIMGALADNDLVLHVNAIDEKYLMTGFQKVANRLTVGLILGSIIVGAALMMNVRTDFTIYGYPGIAIIFFVLAAIGGLILAATIMFNDEKAQKKDGPSI